MHNRIPHTVPVHTEYYGVVLRPTPDGRSYAVDLRGRHKKVKKNRKAIIPILKVIRSL